MILGIGTIIARSCMSFSMFAPVTMAQDWATEVTICGCPVADTLTARKGQMGMSKLGSVLRTFGVPLAIPAAYLLSYLGLQIARTSAGVAMDTLSPVDAVGAVICIGCAAHIFGLQTQAVYRNSGSISALTPHIGALIVALFLGFFSPLTSFLTAVHFLGTVAAWVGLAWVIIVGGVSGWAIGNSFRLVPVWVLSVLTLLAVLVAFWAFLYSTDRCLVELFG